MIVSSIALHVVINHLRRILPPDCSFPLRFCVGCNRKRLGCENTTCITANFYGDYEEYSFPCEQCRYISGRYFNDNFISCPIGKKLKMIEEEEEEEIEKEKNF